MHSLSLHAAVFTTFLHLVSGTVMLTGTEFATITVGKSFYIPYAGAVGPVTITLKNGPQTDLADFLILGSDLPFPQGSISWTPSTDIPNQQYALEITDGSTTNYAGPFQIIGAGASSPSSSSPPTLASATSSSSVESNTIPPPPSTTTQSSVTSSSTSTTPSTTSSTFSDSTSSDSTSSTPPTTSTLQTQTSSTKPTNTITDAPLNSSPAAAASSRGSGGGLSTGAKAGIGVLAAVLGLVIIGLAIWCFRRNFSISKRGNEARGPSGPPELEDTNSPMKHEIGGQGITPELESGAGGHGADVRNPRYELSGK